MKKTTEGGKEIVVKHIARKIMISKNLFASSWLVVLRRRRRRNISPRHDGFDHDQSSPRHFSRLWKLSHHDLHKKVRRKGWIE